ncbi:MAG: nucleotidyltransferase family protein [Bacteroidales bacterium]|nr:nucleotidyltransferase family protein [Bacteroidales bacterium]
MRTDLFLRIIRAGLWEDIESERGTLPEISADEWNTFYSLASEQTVAGLFAAGIEALGLNPSKEVSLKLLGREVSLEKSNSAMNSFIAVLFARLHEEGIRAVLVKGQGIARCYVRPQWRAPGDVDLLLDDANYSAAKTLLMPRASKVEEEFPRHKHLGMFFGKFEVELHGTMYTLLSRRMDGKIAEYQDEMFRSGSFDAWNDDGTEVPLPDADTDVVFIFTHILQHFFKEGIGLRQFCDWARLLWTKRASIDWDLLSRRMEEMGIMKEWKAFIAFAVEYLGLPVEAAPMYDASARWKRKAARILRYVLSTGNFGSARGFNDKKGSLLFSKIAGFFILVSDFFRCYLITFPADSLRFFAYSAGVSLSNFIHGK